MIDGGGGSSIHLVEHPSSVLGYGWKPLSRVRVVSQFPFDEWPASMIAQDCSECLLIETGPGKRQSETIEPGELVDRMATPYYYEANGSTWNQPTMINSSVMEGMKQWYGSTWLRDGNKRDLLGTPSIAADWRGGNQDIFTVPTHPVVIRIPICPIRGDEQVVQILIIPIQTSNRTGAT